MIRAGGMAAVGGGNGGERGMPGAWSEPPAATSGGTKTGKTGAFGGVFLRLKWAGSPRGAPLDSPHSQTFRGRHAGVGSPPMRAAESTGDPVRTNVRAVPGGAAGLMPAEASRR